MKTEIDLVDEISSSFPDLEALLIIHRADEGDERDAWMEADVIADYVADLAKDQSDADALMAVLARIEVLLEQNPSDWAASWVKVGVLETVQSTISNERSRGERTNPAGAIRDKLGPKSLCLWREIDHFWGNSVDGV